MSDFTGWPSDLASQYRSRIRDKSAIRYHLCIMWKPCGGSKPDVRALSRGTALADRQPQRCKEAQMAGVHCVLTAGPSKPGSPRGPKGPMGPYRERGGREGQITDRKEHNEGANVKKHNHITEQNRLTGSPLGPGGPSMPGDPWECMVMKTNKDTRCFYTDTEQLASKYITCPPIKVHVPFSMPPMICYLPRLVFKQTEQRNSPVDLWYRDGPSAPPVLVDPIRIIWKINNIFSRKSQNRAWVPACYLLLCIITYLRSWSSRGSRRSFISLQSPRWDENIYQQNTLDW